MFHSKSIVIVVVRHFHSPWNGMVLLSTDLQGITTSLCNALFTCRLVVCLAHGSDVMPKRNPNLIERDYGGLQTDTHTHILLK